MSELEVDDWKLEAQAVVQLCRKKCDKSVSFSVDEQHIKNYYLITTAGSGAEPPPKSNLMHFIHKI